MGRGDELVRVGVDAGRDARGQHVANLLAFQPDETIAQVLAIPDYEASDYLVLATRRGMVKKTRLSEYDTNRQGGIIAINLRDGDELVVHRCDLDAGQSYKRTTFNFAVHRQPDQYRMIVERKGAIPPPEA